MYAHPSLSASHPVGITLCVPVYNDWACAAVLLQRIDEVAAQLNQPVSVLLVNDGSSEAAPPLLEPALRHITHVEILHLRRNVGHQRAIALGLAYLHDSYPDRLTVVMDGDGEDDPRSLPALMARCGQLGDAKIVFASRRKRTEGLLFRAGYWLFRVLHVMLIGRSVRVGNFSIIPPHLLARVVGVSEVWNHYAAGVHHARLPIDAIPIDRGHRLAGKSKMNFVSLVTHGMSAISVYGDVVGVRLLCVAGLLTVVAVAALAGIAAVRLGTDWAIPGWATTACGFMVLILLTLFTLSMVLVLFVLQSRSLANFLPLRDWTYYVAGEETIHESSLCVPRLRIGDVRPGAALETVSGGTASPLYPRPRLGGGRGTGIDDTHVAMRR
jgi:hypothetical protein